MTRRRRGRASARAVLFSSLIGAVGVPCADVSGPGDPPLVLAFGPPEFMMLTLLGLSFIVSLAGRQLMKGRHHGGFGVCLAMVGLDPQSSIQRFTFGTCTCGRRNTAVVPGVVGIFGGTR